MKDVILAAAISYSYSHVELFLRSINKVYTGDVVIFSDRKYKLEPFNYNIKLVHPDEYLPIIPGAITLNTPNNYRFCLYAAYLSKNKYDRVFLTDCRDVFVQLDPFQKVNSERLYVAIEDNTIGNCVYNSTWMKTLYGEDYFQQIKNNEIVCAGTMLCVYAAVMKYLEYVTAQMEKFGPGLDTGDKVFMLDQAIINHFCHEFPGSVTKMTNRDELFLTAGYTSLFHCDKSGQIVNAAASPYAVIHQFDRIPWLARHLQEQSVLTEKNQSLYKNTSVGFKELIHLIKRFIKRKLSFK